MRKIKDSKTKEGVVPVPTIRRLPLYLSFLKSRKNKEKKFISAPEIAKELFIDPSQITKDFSHIDITGKTKIGYDSASLIIVIERFLGYHISRKAFMVGIGNLGVALLNYNEFIKEGIEITGGFDISANKIGTTINGIKVQNTDKFKECFDNTPVEIGIITVPAHQAQKVANIMIDCGIKAIWNFSALPVSAPDNIIIENTSIDSGLAMIKWKLNRNKPLIYKNRIL